MADRANPQSVLFDRRNTLLRDVKLRDGQRLAGRRRLTFFLLPAIAAAGPQPRQRAGYDLPGHLKAATPTPTSFAARLRGLRGPA